ncbi:MAG: acyl-CoA thioesterase, partial [Comamonadaceae bacterium]
FTMVAVDEARKSVPVSPLRPFSLDERRRHAGALVRKQLRQEMAARAEAARTQSA